MHVPAHHDPDDDARAHQDGNWADLAGLGLPDVEPEDQPRPRRGLRTLVTLALAAAVVAGGVAVVAPAVSKAMTGSQDTDATPSAEPTTLSEGELAAERRAEAASKRADRAEKAAKEAEESAKATPSSSAETAPAGINVAGLADATWVRRVAQEAGIPERALAAYAGASLRVQQLRPQCGLGWNTLAAIGNVESHHGSINGNSLGADGTVRPGVYGVALDGSDKVAAIPDTDRGTLDGDAEWDRAVGPMQFIPSTWESVKQDGNGDGMVDVQQLDDAALSAGMYLCDAGRDLTESADWIKAVASYNPSLQYNNDIARIATEYAGIN
jgi:membrane-bound lytic murein transglycosylase B